MRQTIHTSPSWVGEKRMPMARQGQDEGSNKMNSGFYPAAISATMATRPSPYHLYDTTKLPGRDGRRTSDR
jgi:hypothetical protein